MAAESEESLVLRGVLISAAVLVLYVLCFGPASFFMMFGRAPHWVGTVYSPLFWTSANCEPARKALEWYMHLWLDILL